MPHPLIVYLRYTMAINKKTEFQDSIQRFASFAKLLSHPARIAILEVLASRQTCVCGEIVEVLPLAQSTVSQHLKELKERWVSERNSGRHQLLLLYQLGNF